MKRIINRSLKFNNMVTTKKIKGLDFTSIEQYFDYIIESIINGQRQQATGLIKDLDKNQKKRFINYLRTLDFDGDDHTKEAFNLTLSLM